MKRKLMTFFLVLTLMLGLSLTKFANITNASGYEYAWFPVPAMNITQIAYESYSHSNSNAIDCVGGTYAFAPFTGKIVNVSKSYGVALFQSIDKVYYPDGTLDYMTVQFMHGSNYDYWKSCYDSGTIIPQGTDFYKIGGTGSDGVTQVYSPHYDIQVYKGATSSFTSYFSAFGNTFSFNAFYINPSKTTSIINKGKVAPGNVVYNGAPSDYSNLWRNLGTSHISITYQTWDDVTNQWLPNVVDTTDYAGIYGHDVCAVYANLSSGNITYKVHVKGGSWLPAVVNRTDYAGMYNYPIDGLAMTTDTGRTIHYRVHLRPSGIWLPYVTGYNTADPNNGYAGTLGQEIDGIQAYLD